ncbi:PREDICTED: polyprenol reductase-like [Wasmannia auropunctata]|uniref:polyprenol reductase-like n=1 Tax=Wasmannia auropunctata TaxID=64793 RepID=UPI0005EF89FD|nr:PREDICTED: polyprenol reductase-like [Wasmannia auropunctata]XP_011698342.1 PREDICTED: polyprenol reductase-like [Wasmannia auropunctata]
MDTNIMRNLFILNSAGIILIGLSINFLEPYLPALIKRGILYGKFSIKAPHAIASKLEVPKRWFRHFYILCAPLMTITLCLVLYKNLYNGSIPEIVFTLLDALLGTSRKPLISAEDAILAIVIYNIHCWKRFYETCYINVFSNQKIHIFVYLVGHIHYMGLILCILGESAGFVKGSHANVSLHKITTVKLVCAFICLWSSYMQLKTNFILAKLRKNTHGDVVSLEYKIPSGGLFKYIAGPLQLCEILIYLMLSMILWQASTYHFVTLWVISNQVECAVLCHRWYRKTFKNYPKERKILIPYIW